MTNAKKPSTNNKKKTNKTSTTVNSSSGNKEDPMKGVAIMTRLLGENLVQAVPEGKSDNTKTAKKKKMMTTNLVSTKDILKSKEFVGLYFASQWSNKSIEFTPKLIEFYNQLNMIHHNDKNPKKNDTSNKQQDFLEIVYVSADQNREQFNQHFLGIEDINDENVNDTTKNVTDNKDTNTTTTTTKTTSCMPWYAMESETSEQCKLKNDLVPIFKSFRIPCLIILHVPTGQFVTENGKDDILHLFFTDDEEEKKVSAEKNKKKNDDDDPKQGPSTAVLDKKKKRVMDVIQRWKSIPLDSIQNAQMTVSYNSGMMKLVKYFIQNPLVASALIALLVLTPIVQYFIDKPLLLVGVFYFVKKWTDIPGDTILPGLPFTSTATATATETELKKNQ